MHIRDDNYSTVPTIRRDGESFFFLTEDDLLLEVQLVDTYVNAAGNITGLFRDNLGREYPHGMLLCHSENEGPDTRVTFFPNVSPHGKGYTAYASADDFRQGLAMDKILLATIPVKHAEAPVDANIREFTVRNWRVDDDGTPVPETSAAHRGKICPDGTMELRSADGGDFLKADRYWTYAEAAAAGRKRRQEKGDVSLIGRKAWTVNIKALFRGQATVLAHTREDAVRIIENHMLAHPGPVHCGDAAIEDWHLEDRCRITKDTN